MQNQISEKKQHNWHFQYVFTEFVNMRALRASLKVVNFQFLKNYKV